MTFLIDGYNLLHAIGLATRGLPPKGLDRARTRLLDWLADSIRDRPDVLRVVFDAKAAPAESAEVGRRGVRVRFAFRQTADELIEELVRAERHPARLTVVSNDGQVQDAGRHRGCAVLTCQQFTDWLIADAAPPAPASPPSKPEPTATADEMAAWLAAFSKPKKRR